MKCKVEVIYMRGKKKSQEYTNHVLVTRTGRIRRKMSIDDDVMFIEVEIMEKHSSISCDASFG